MGLSGADEAAAAETFPGSGGGIADRPALSARLGERRGEIEKALAFRIHGISSPSETQDPAYRHGLRSALTAAVDYALATVELSEANAPRVPIAIATQARLAARHGVPLETVLRRYFAGVSLLGDFVVEEAAGSDLSPADLQQVLRDLSVQLDRLVVVVSAEHGREARDRMGSSEGRRAERVRRLVEGESLDASGFAYEFDLHHLGAIACGPGADELLRGIAAAADARLLLVPHGEEIVWAWLGARRPLDTTRIEAIARESLRPQVRLALGEPGKQLSGWRLSHRQARAALPIALGGSQRIVRYADVALLASMAQDRLLVMSLHRTFLAPLLRERDGGETLRKTLRAYFASGRNASSAAAALGVDRKTVTNRLAAAEERLGRPLSTCAAEVEAALRLEELGDIHHASNRESPVEFLLDHL
ncbi:MAG TPA: helix-turn-helix domain-containing protein [Solirubrobacterales bacterium]|nr:helix-turn-helix domain-containing protein [Solirubrobacterales bacterium]